MSETAALDIDYLRTWIGKVEEQKDIVTAHAVKGMRATLFLEPGEPKAGDPAPVTMHWCYMMPIAKASEIGPDGHPARGGFLPPVPLPRRMWAGGRFQFLQPLRVGDAINRTSEIVNVTMKEGRTGALVFVLVRHHIGNANGVAVVEEHDIVYRDLPPTAEAPPPPPKAPEGAVWKRTIEPDDVLLFRYSALTFNGHRIHYDRRYVTGVEGYPGLIVHGPLIATLLTDLIRRNAQASMTAFRFKAVSPLFDIAPFSLCGTPSADGQQVDVWAQGSAGQLAMEAQATLAV